MERADAGEELVELERLGEIVVGARVQSADHVLDGVAGSEHEDRSVTTFPSELVGDLESILLRQQQVEQDDVVIIGVCQHGGLLAIRGHVDDVSLFLQSVVDESGHLGVVFDDEDLHESQSRERT